MANARIVTDSSCELPPDISDQLQITVLPWRVRVGAQMHGDSAALRTAEHYREMIDGKLLPSAAPPTAAEFGRVFEALTSETDQIIVVAPSAKLARIVAAAQQARQAFLGRCVIQVLDSTFIGRTMGILVEQAALLAQQGATANEIVRQTSGLIPRSYLAIYTDSLTTMAQKGLVDDRDEEVRGTPSYRPLLLVEDGQVVPLQRSRKRGAPSERIIEFIGEFRSLSQLYYLHNGQSSLMDEIKAAMAEARPDQPYQEHIYGPVFASLMGVRAFGVAAFEA
jgi:DegV family protein with EDD domain